MGIYFNPTNEGFVSDVKSKIYVDKTSMINYLNSVLSTRERYISVSHARRFGKSHYDKESKKHECIIESLNF